MDIVALGDLNRDGVEEFAVADPCPYRGRAGCENLVWILSGMSCEIYRKLRSPESVGWLRPLRADDMLSLIVAGPGGRGEHLWA